MPGLRDLHWGTAVIPDRVLEFLGKNPKVRLHLSVDIRFFPGHAEEAATALRALLACLAGTQGLSSLRIKIVYGREAVALRTLLQDSLRPLIMSSPRLRSLGLDIGFPTLGCVWHRPSRDYCGFGFSAGDAFPPLQELDVVDYPWGRPHWLPRGLFWVDGYPTALGPGTEMEHWASLHDWSRLRRLRLVGSSIMLAAHLAPKLTALQHIELISRNEVIDKRIAPIFAALPLPCALTSITLAVLPLDLIPLITAHAASIRALSVYDPPIPPADLALLRDRLPNLDTLTLRDPDPPSGAWPCATTLATVASFPRLRSLTLWISPHPHPDPPITIATPGRLFATLRARGAVRLCTLRLNAGVPLPPRANPQLGFGAHPAKDQGSAFVCSWPPEGAAWMEDVSAAAADNGGEEEGGKALPLLEASRCVNLGWAQNERLRRVARGEPMTEREARTLEFVVALRGPMGAPGEWEAWKETGWVEWNRAAAAEGGTETVRTAETLESGWVSGRRVREKLRALFAT
jgi:hypothetical protein